MSVSIGDPSIPREVTACATSMLGRDLVQRFLDDQGRMTAVERFSTTHDSGILKSSAERFSPLIPLNQPGNGEQYGFEVDLDRCSGCKACVAACHTLNGLDDNESWREVSTVVGGAWDLPVLQHVTSACHHCLDPACLAACPVDAYEKHPVTGIVRHLDDQCFGCQYCTLACPYDAPKYHSKKGIVRKCDMCAERLAEGEAPACAQACPHEAIKIGVVNVDELVRIRTTEELLPGTCEGTYTFPTTQYRRSRGDIVPTPTAPILKPEHVHTPLVAMLVLTQLAVGGFCVALAARLMDREDLFYEPVLSAFCFLIGGLGAVASLFHLGRPQLAYRALIGLRHSWLSREILAFGAFGQLGGIYVFDRLGPTFIAKLSSPLSLTLLALTCLTGLVGVYCSVMVYHAVNRPFWRFGRVVVRFLGSTFVLGISIALVAMVLTGFGPKARFSGRLEETVAMLAPTLAAVMVLKLRREHSSLFSTNPDESASLAGSRQLIAGPLKRLRGKRMFWGIAGGVFMPIAVLISVLAGNPGGAGGAALLSIVAVLKGEIYERTLFFAAVVRHRMPGGDR